MLQKDWKTKEWKRLLRKNDWYFLRPGKGSHEIWTNGQEKMAIQQKINAMQARRLIKEFSLQVN